jgi:hypothetical protein
MSDSDVKHSTWGSIARWALSVPIIMLGCWFAGSIASDIAIAIGWDGYSDAAGSGYEDATDAWKRTVVIGTTLGGTATGALVARLVRRRHRWLIGAVIGAAIGVGYGFFRVEFESFLAGLN